MFTLQAPSRNLLSRRVHRNAAPRNVVDYLDALRGVKPRWGVPDDRSPQWLAATELGPTPFWERLHGALVALTRIRHSRPTDWERLKSQIAVYVADVAALDDQVDAFNGLFNSIALNKTRMPIDTDPFVPTRDPFASHPWSYSEWEVRRRRETREEEARVRFASGLFSPKDPGEVLGPSIIDAELLVGDRASVLGACQADIAWRCEAATHYMWNSLVWGVGHGLLGIVSWNAPDVCWYVRSEHRLQVKGDPGRNVYEHWHVCKEVHLMDAMHLAGIPGWLELPRSVQNVVDAIPPILHPEIGTVVGTMVKEREISWLEGEVRYPAERVVPQRRLVFDPAIVIGPVVLTGWELPEHSREKWWMKLDCMLAR